MRESKAAESSRSTPGWSPPPDAVVSLTGVRSSVFRWRASISRNASSITDVNVLFERAASCLTSTNRSSSSRMVVLMHQSISYYHIDVKQWPDLFRRDASARWSQSGAIGPCHCAVRNAQELQLPHPTAHPYHDGMFLPYLRSLECMLSDATDNRGITFSTRFVLPDSVRQRGAAG